MPVPDSHPRNHRFGKAALLAGALIAALFVALSWGRLYLTGQSPGGVDEIVLGVLVDLLLAVVAFVPFLLAVLFVVDDPSQPAVARGAALIYVVDLLLAVGQGFLGEFPGTFSLTVLAVPLPRVLTFLGVATAVWIAYHGGYERLAAAVGNPDQHPLFANLADKRIGASLSLQSGLVGAGLAAVVSAGGQVVVGVGMDLLRAVTRSGAAGSGTGVSPLGQGWGAGIPLADLPAEWLFAASFLLAVLFVTGPRLRPRDFIKGIVVIYGVQSAVHLLPVLVSPSHPVQFWTVSGPFLEPMGDVIRLAGITVAVWLTFHGRLKPLDRSSRSTPDTDDQM